MPTLFTRKEARERLLTLFEESLARIIPAEEAVIEALAGESDRRVSPQEGDGPQHPRRVLAQNANYFTKHKEDMRYGFFPIVRGNL